VSADALLRDSFVLAEAVRQSGFVPDAMVVLWRGGAPIGIAMHEYLLHHGVEVEDLPLKVRTYEGIESPGVPRIEALDTLLDRVTVTSRVLLVDDIYDTGRSVAAVRKHLASRVHEIRVATVFYKPGQNPDAPPPDYYLHETAAWIVFPHELDGLSDRELAQKGMG
jgi:hypoxanthine phosphoribosyltransferase